MGIKILLWIIISTRAYAESSISATITPPATTTATSSASVYVDKDGDTITVLDAAARNMLRPSKENRPVPLDTEVKDTEKPK